MPKSLLPPETQDWASEPPEPSNGTADIARVVPTDPMHYFANDGAAVRLCALAQTKLPAIALLLLLAAQWLRLV